jgi:hypothetical protein
MRITNWNLQRVHPSEGRAELILRHLKLVDTDIWVLTETHELIGTGEFFSSVMSDKYDAESKPGEYWAGIWSRFPIRHLPSLVSDGSR